MNNSIIHIDPTCIGPTVLVSVSPDFFGDKKEKQSVPQGAKYEVILPAHRYDKLVVKIPGEQVLDTPVSGHEPTVEFIDLCVKPYVDRAGRLAFTATATGVKVISSTASGTEKASSSKG